MTSAPLYRDRKDKIRRALEARAKEGQTIFYSELGAIVGIPATGPWKPVLDSISLEDRAAQRPDISYLVVSKKTGLPAQIEFAEAKPPRPEQKKLARETIQSVFDYYK